MPGQSKSITIPPTPPALYKYCSFDEWTQSIFERNEIYFQSPDCFNDPFDSKISTTYEGSEEQRISRLKSLEHERIRKGLRKEEPEETLHLKAVEVVASGKEIPLLLKSGERSTDRMRKQLGIFCMTHQKDNILMWSHYADEHVGFCLEFQTSNDFFGRALPIDYRLDRPCVNLIKTPNPKKMADAMLTKAEGWEYEKEWRIVDLKGPGIKTYPPEALSGVILGCRISPGNRQRITQWCRARNPQPALYWAEEKDREFGLDIRPINQ